MTHVVSRKHAAFPAGTLAVLAGLALPAALEAQAPERPREKEMAEVKVKARREVPYKAEKSASPKQTQPLLDTPRTIQVVKQEMLQEQGAASLMEALRNTPGITLQLGENGSTAAGDTFQMRGFSAQTATFVDGIRDLGAVTRDVFNLEQVEVVKGPAGAETGRASSSGYLNLVSKLPRREPLTEALLTAGTAGRKRFTADLDRPLGDTAAFRLNVMAQDGGVEGRDIVQNKGWAVAPAVAFGLGTATRLYLYSQHLKADNIPDGGIPTVGQSGFTSTDARLQGAPAVDPHAFYGSRSDRERIDAHQLTSLLEVDLGPQTTLRSLTRMGRTHMDRVMTGVYTLNVPSGDPSTWTVNRLRQRLDQTNEILANQTGIVTAFQTFGLTHDLSAGMELLYERQLNLGTGTAATTIRGTSLPAILNPPAGLYAPDPDQALGVPYLTGIDTDGATLTGGLYAFDTVGLAPGWKLQGGLRFERYRTTTSSGTLVTAANLAQNPGYAVGGVVPVDLQDAANLSSWNLGLVYKPVDTGTFYAAAGNALLPPGGANIALSATAGNQAQAGLEPQQTRSLEAGTKWELLDRRLQVSGALYRAENDRQVSQDPTDGTYHQYGRTRVDGLEVAAVGQVTRAWQVSAGVSRMRTRQLDQRSRNSTTGAVTESDGVRWSPDLAATLWTSWSRGGFTVGGGLRYLSEQKRVITRGADLATQLMPKIPASTVVDLMAAWRIHRSTNLQLNVGNAFNRVYIASLNNSGLRARMGTPRSASLSARVQF